MAKPHERRMAVTDLQLRESSDGLHLTGYASTFNQPYDMGWYTEQVDPLAFRETLGRKPDVRLLVNHGGLPLARTASGTLALDTDSRGLRVAATLDPSDPDVASLAPKMRRGDLNQMSFSFRCAGNGDHWSPDMSMRTLRNLDLNDGDVSVVTYPANPSTTAAVRGAGHPLEAVASALRELEQRAASPEDAAAVLQRALGYVQSIDTIADGALVDLSNALGVPNPDCLIDADGPDADDSAPAMREDGTERIVAVMDQESGEWEHLDDATASEATRESYLEDLEARRRELMRLL